MQSIIQTRSQKLKSATNSLNQNQHTYDKSKVSDKWLDDHVLDAYFQAFSEDISKSRNDITFLGPSSSQLLKCGDPYQILELVTCLSLETFNYIFFCVNDSIETNYDHTKYKY